MTARFKFMRCGLISLFHYANQVFDAEDGHLLLRGSNGSGKSTAVELVVPLLFDGNLTSSNLSTSDGQRSIVYHLLLDGLYTRRLGYSWAQFALHDEDGGERWVTLALGVKAAQDTRHDAWFAIWDTPVMVDPQVMLVRPDQAPLGRREVAQLPGVELYDSAEDYRARVNALLFGFSARRYEAMLKLMRRLRSAQLGKAINVAQTTELLELALPELDVELLAGVGGKLDELESLRGELSALQEADAAAGRFVDRYRDFARGVVARELGTADDIVRAARREERKERRLAGERETAAEALAQAERDIARVDEQIAHVQGELRALHASERWRAVEEVGAAQARATDQDERARRAEARVAELRDEEAVLARELAAAGEELTGAERALDAAGASLREACAAAGLADLLQLPLRAPAVELLDSARRTRRTALRELADLHAACASARAEADRQRSALDVAEAAERDLRARRDELEVEREEAQERLAEAVDAWAAGLTELRPEPGEALDEAVLRATRRLAAEEEQCSARRRELAVLRAALEAEQSDLHAELDPPPPVAPWRDAEQPGAPLWRLCDFAPSLDERARAGLERALEASGLLDARVDEGGALRSGHLVIEGVPHSTAVTLSHSAAPPYESPAVPALAAAGEASGPGAAASRAAAGLAGEAPGPSAAASRAAAGLAGEVPGTSAAAARAGAGLAGSAPGTSAAVARVAVAGVDAAAGRAAAAGIDGAAGRAAAAGIDAAGSRAVAGPAGEAPGSGARTLADVLSAPAALLPALRAVTVLDEDARGPLAVALDGTFALGPLRGKGADAPARFIGADARQAAREQRIDAIDRELARLADEDAKVDDALATLQVRARTLQQERASEPRLEGDAGARHAALGRELETRRAAIDAQRETARAATDQLATAERAVLAHAAAHHLPHAPDPALAEALDRLTEALPEARSTLAHRERLRSQRRERYERHERVIERRDRARAEAAGERRQAEELAGFAQRLSATTGEDRDEVLRDAEALDAELAQFARHREQLNADARTHTGAMERLGAQRDAAAAELERQLRQQDARAARLTELDGAGLIALALGNGHEPGAQWDAERITQLSKARRSQLEATEEVSANAIYREFDELRAALDGSLGIEAVLDVLGDVPVISAAYGGAHVPIADAARSLKEELQRQQSTLADQEEELFEEFLFGDVANELRARIADADEIAQAAAQKISAVRTSSGIGVDLRWELRPDLDPSVRNVIALLRRSDPRALPAQQRGTLMGFFRDRLAEARAGEEHATLVEHLRTTLDYRAWFKFRIFQIKDGTRSELTRRAHSRDSGGEKSVTLHLPLLAAYHALLTGAHANAPRLVALDEAFAGIDRSGQQQLLEVLDDKFDLDFVLTSEKLWCFEPQVHRLGVYQLRRFEGAPVAAVHWRWWGDQRRKEMVGLHAIRDSSESHAA